MSSRPTPPQPVKRWPFIVGDLAFLAMAAITLASSDTPPGLGSILLATACVLLGIGLLIAPHLIEYEGRLRYAEASARDAIETQIRRVGQTAEQLANAVSRSQSTEEQANQALGTLEELSEKLGAQADDLSQLLAKINTREQETLRAEIQEITRERDEKLAALEDRITMVADAVGENRAATKRANAANAEALAQIRGQLERIADRMADRALPPETSAATPPPENREAEPVTVEAQPKPAQSTGLAPADAEKPDDDGIAEETTTDDSEAAADPAEADEAKNGPDSGPNPSSEAPAAEPPMEKSPKSARRGSDSPKKRKSVPRRQSSDSMELAFEGDAAPKKPSRRDAGPATSLVATAYIGIGNKLYLRGEGPGLNWDEGAPMQFLAIGKWGWTTTEAEGQIVCRIYRNDETPMLDEDIIVEAGSKAEVTPRF